MPISSPGPLSLSITSWPLAPTCNNFTQPEMSSRTCCTESPWQKITCALSNFFSCAAETISLQAGKEAPENNEERSARAAAWLTAEFWPKRCPAGCNSPAALSSALGWVDFIFWYPNRYRLGTPSSNFVCHTHISSYDRVHIRRTRQPDVCQK